MESQLLHILLALMQEHQLGRNVDILVLGHLRLVYFNREVPQGKLIVFRCDSQHGLFPGLKLDRSDWGGVPSNSRDGIKVTSFLGRDGPKIPDSELTLVIARGQQEFRRRVPRDDIYVAVVGLPADLGLQLGCSQIPQLDSLVDRTRGQYLFLRGTPLDVLDRVFMTLEGNLVLLDEMGAGLVACLIEPEVGAAGAHSKSSEGVGRPVHGKPFTFMLESGQFTSSHGLLLGILALNCGLVEGIKSLADVINPDLGIFVPSGNDG